MGKITENVKLTEELIDDFIGCRSGLDYDGLKFDLGVLPHALHIGGVTIMYEKDDTDNIRKMIGCATHEINDWVKEYGSTVARDMVRYSIAHEMGRMKQLKDEDFKGGPVELTPKMEARADAYAMYTLGISKDYYFELFDNVVEAALRDTNCLTWWNKFKDNGTIKSRKKEAVDYVEEWEGKAEKLKKQISMWADHILEQAEIFDFQVTA